jgi:TonB family protein
VTEVLPQTDLGEKIPEFEYDIDLGELLRSSIPQPTSSEVIIKRLIKPVYPPESVLKEVEGQVNLKVLVSKQGYVVKVWLIDSNVDDLCENSAISAAWRFEFEPYLKDGKPVNMLVSVPIEFRLRDRLPEPG